MTDVEIWALQQFSASGSDVRMYYTTMVIDTVSYQKLQYIAVSPSIDAPITSKAWYIGKLYYESTYGCMIRFVKLATQEILDDRGSLFPT